MILVLVAIAALALYSLPKATRERIADEHGPIENSSTALLGLSAVVAMVRLAQKPSKAWLAGMLLVIWAFFRELDFQKRFTYRSIESIGFYSSDKASLSQKLIAVLALLPFVCAVFYLLMLIRRHLPGAWPKRETWIIHAAVTIALGIVGMGAEKFFEMMVLEEVCEVGVSAMVLLLVSTCGRDQATRPAADFSR